MLYEQTSVANPLSPPPLLFLCKGLAPERPALPSLLSAQDKQVSSTLYQVINWWWEGKVLSLRSSHQMYRYFQGYWFLPRKVYCLFLIHFKAAILGSPQNKAQKCKNDASYTIGNVYINSLSLCQYHTISNICAFIQVCFVCHNENHVWTENVV